MGDASTRDRRRRTVPVFEWLRHPVTWTRTWPLWALQSRVLWYVFSVEAVAILAAVYTGLDFTVTRTDWTRVVILAACAIVHIEASRKVERQREISAGSGPYLDYKSTWNFAALVVLPPVMATGMIVLTYGYAWVRIWSGKKNTLACFRWVFSGATVVLASQIAVAVLVFAAPVYPGVPQDVHGVLVIAAAAGVRWLINYLLVLFVLALSLPQITARDLTAGFRDQIMEAGAVSFGLCTAALLVYQPILVTFPVVGLIAMHRTVLLGQLERAAQTDAKTGLSTDEWWKRHAEQVLERAQVNSTNVGIMMIDLDYFKRINDTYGHVKGDEVLAAVAQAITGEVRTDFDTVGRFGGEEFAVLLPEITEDELRLSAERIRRRVGMTFIDVMTDDGPQAISVTVSIGAAFFPGNGTTIADLTNAADIALYRAKELGRDRALLADDITNHPQKQPESA